ncbi:MAG: hypothetical protein CL816_08530 [Coxiellaceae bacterium]|nr:hypothetical protein [Coxiellaceae bacterium]|tara:strand:- start:1340 stop:2587 length:1248 start_codon:yes stop_codon:yes gene_type:complete
MTDIILNHCQFYSKQFTCLKTDWNIHIKDRHIHAITKEPITLQDATVFDLSGYTLLPGLIDAHLHIASPPSNLITDSYADTYIGIFAKIELEKMIDRGFTTIRDAGGDVYGIASAIKKGLIRAPRLFYSGRALSQTGGHGDFRSLPQLFVPCSCTNSGSIISRIADGISEVRKAARDELRKGASQIKVFASGGVTSPNDSIYDLQYSQEELKAIVEEASLRHTYVMAHVFTPEGIIRCLEAGVRTIEHGFLLDDKSAKMMHKKKAYLVPTYTISDAFLKHSSDYGLSEDNIRKSKTVEKQSKQALHHAIQHRVKIGLGSDVFGDAMQYQSNELKLRSELQPNCDVLYSATEVNAEILHQEHQLGKIQESYLADIIAVKGDPCENIDLLLEQGKHIHLVIRDGEVVKNLDIKTNNG